MATQTQTIDCQVHCYARNTPERPWRNHLEGPDEVTGDDMVAAMDAVGVDGAILISPFSLYGYDPSYIPGVYDQHPRQVRSSPPLRPHLRHHRRRRGPVDLHPRRRGLSRHAVQPGLRS